MSGSVDVADELAIRSLLARYADAASRRDADAWIASWAPDCVWDLGGGRVTRGHDETLALWRTSIAKYPWVVQIPASGFLELRDGVVHGTWYVIEFSNLLDGTGVTHVGHYRDTYARVDDAWRFATRRFHLIYRGALDPGTVRPLEEDGS